MKGERQKWLIWFFIFMIIVYFYPLGSKCSNAGDLLLFSLLIGYADGILYSLTNIQPSDISIAGFVAVWVCTPVQAALVGLMGSITGAIFRTDTTLTAIRKAGRTAAAMFVASILWTWFGADLGTLTGLGVAALSVLACLVVRGVLKGRPWNFRYGGNEFFWYPGLAYLGALLWTWYTPAATAYLLCLPLLEYMWETSSGSRLSNLRSLVSVVLEQMSSGVIVTDTNGVPTLANRRAREIFSGAGMPRIDPPDARLDRLLKEVAANPSFRTHMTFHGQDKSVMLRVLAEQLRDEAELPIGSVALIEDVTDAAVMEYKVREAEKMAALGELAAAAAHEIRNPLSAIKAFVQLLGKDTTTPLEERLRMLEREIARLDHITSDLLTMARPGSQRWQRCYIEAILDEVLLLYSERARSQEVEIQRCFRLDKKAICCDGSQMRQVFSNLISNALDATSKGGRIRVSTCRTENYVSISVSDTGCGIPPANLAKVFNPFFTTKEMGTGLGLAIAYGAVKNHHGYIEIESEVGKGTTVTVHLPDTYQERTES
ncbi:MAG: ATP-binding protein [Bacillota bacterium]